jgi:hypothetical protein
VRQKGIGPPGLLACFMRSGLAQPPRIQAESSSSTSLYSLAAAMEQLPNGNPGLASAPLAVLNNQRKESRVTQRIHIGTWHGVAFEVAVWDAVAAEVELSAACLFEHEAVGALLKGGAKHLDDALGNALSSLRTSGHFRAKAGQSLLLDRPPTGIAGRAVLILGLGDPAVWTPAVSGSAVALTLQCAIARKAASAAFAPSLLDAGVDGGHAGAALLPAAAAAIEAAHEAASMSLAEPLVLQRFAFDAGPAHLETALHHFRNAFATLRPPGTPS